jgi:hypothetical protein
MAPKQNCRPCDNSRAFGGGYGQDSWAPSTPQATSKASFILIESDYPNPSHNGSGWSEEEEEEVVVEIIHY